MADDIQSNIRINVDTASAMDSIRLLQNQISAFHTQMAKMGAASAADSRNMQQNLINSINSTGAFTANMTKVRTTAEQFTHSLEKNKLSMGEYFRYAGGASKSFGKLFKTEFETINKVARERVKDLQTQYIKLGRDANGAMQAIKVRPLTLDMQNLGTKTQIAAQRQQLLNQLLKQGSTNLLNFGKNTQWAGRQLMVGFTVPLSIMGAAAMRAYKDIEEAAIRLKRVYGDLGTTNMETEKMVKQVQMLAQEYTKYGVAVKDSMDMAATAAATGKKGADLLAQVASSARLAVLGGVDQQMALKTTISLTDAFGVSTKQLSKDINFLNAVENQTVLSIEDMTIAIPKAAPVIQQLGGDVKDLAFFLTAMKEGGINASESANALKSGLASLINPTNTASKMLQGFGINLREIVQGNKGDVKKTVIDFAKALDTLDPLNRAKAIEQLFGKFQFARMSTLFKNVIEQGSQASEVLKLASQSSLELSMLAQRELNKIEQSPLYKFQKAIADFQAQLAPVGEQFMKALTPIINFGTDVLKNFNNLGEGVKGFIVKFVAIAGVVGPVLLMSFGLIANAVANVIKGFALMKDIFNKTGKSSLSLGEQVNYMTQEQINAAAIASSLDQVHSKLKQTFTSEAAAVDMLTAAYERSVAAQRAFNVPITPRGPVGKGPVRKYANGGIISGPGTGTSDSILAMVSNGEAIIPAASVARNPGMVRQLVSGNIPGFAEGTTGQVKVQGPKSRIFEQAHFSGYAGMTGEELLNWSINQPESVEKKVKELLSKQLKYFGNEQEMLAHTFQVYNNEVVNMTADINNRLGQSGAGRKGASVTAGELQREFSTSREQAHGQVAAELERMGVAPQKIQKIVTSLADELDTSLGKLSSTAKVSGEELDAIIQSTYKKVGASSRELTAAQASMAQPSGFRSLESTSSPTRLGFTTKDSESPFYKTQRSENYAAAQRYSQEAAKWIDKVSINFVGTQARQYKEMFQKLVLANESAAIEVMNTPMADREAKLIALAKKNGIALSNALVTGTEQGFNVATQRNSPPKQLTQAGHDSGKALVTGARSQIDDAAVAGKVIGATITQNALGGSRVISDGIITPGATQAQQVAEATKKKGRVTSVGDVIPGQTVQLVDYSNPGKSGMQNAVTDPSQMMTGRKMGYLEKAGARYNNFFTNAGDKVAKMDPGKFQGKMFGGSMVAGLASMVLPGAAGQVAGAASMFMGIGGMFKNLGPVVGKLIPLFGKLIPYVGLAITAYEAFDKIIMPLIRKNADAYAALTDTLKITQDKLTKVNDFFGTDIKLTGIRAMQVTGSDQTEAQTSIAKQFQSSEQFKEVYKPQAEKLKNLSDVEVTNALKALAVDLFGQGMEKEQVKAIIDAIKNEAGKEKISISESIFSLNDPAGQAAMKQNAQQAAKNFSEDFGDYWSNNGSTIADQITGKGEGWMDAPIFRDQQNLEELKANASTFGSYISGLSGQLQNGVISTKRFNIEYAQLIEITGKMPNATGVEFFNAALASLGPEAAKAASAIRGLALAQQALIGEALTKGVSISQDVLNTLQFTRGTEQFNKQMQNVEKAIRKQDIINSQITAKKKQLTGIQNQTEQIEGLEEKINDKYDKRIAQIEKIKKLNDQIAKSQQGQLSLAEALNRGDIAAAARAAIDIQNNDIQASLENQQDGLDEARKTELKPLQDSQTQLSNSVNDLSASIDVLSTKLETNSVEQSGKAPVVEFGNNKNDFSGWVDAIFNIGMQSSGSVFDIFNPEFWKDPQKFTLNKAKGMLKYVPGYDVVDGKLVPKQTNADGGYIAGPGTGTSDDIPAMLSNGEYVIRANAVKTIGVDTLNKLNQADRLGFAAGGMVNSFKKKKPKPPKPKPYTLEDLAKPITRKDDPDWYDYTHNFFEGSGMPFVSKHKWSDAHQGFYRGQSPSSKRGVRDILDVKDGKVSFTSVAGAIKYYKALIHSRRQAPEYISTILGDNYWTGYGDKQGTARANSMYNRMFGNYNGLDKAEAKVLASAMTRLWGKDSVKTGFETLGLSPDLLTNKSMFKDWDAPGKKAWLSYTKNNKDFVPPMLSPNTPKYADGGMVGYKDGGKVKKSRGYPAAFNVTSSVGQQQAERNRLYKQGGFQGFEAGANSFMADLMGGPAGGALKGIGKYLEDHPDLNFLLSTLSLPVNLIGGASRGAMNTGKALAKGDLLGAATAGLRGIGDAFASTYGNIFDKENTYKSQFEVLAEDAINDNLFGAKNNKEMAALARIIGGTADLAADPLNYVGIGLAAKAAKVGTIGKNIKTSLGIRGAKNALKAAAADSGTDVSKVGKLTPALAFNLSDEALAGVIKDNFYGNMRVPGMRSSTKDSLENRILVEQSMMGISPNAPASKTPAYGFLTTREDVPSYYNSIMGGMSPRSREQAAIDYFNRLINPESRYLGRYGENTIKLKPDALGRATISMGDSLSIWDQAIRLGKKIPKVDKLSSLFSTFPALSGKLGSTQKMMNTEIRGIKTPTAFPYIEAHLPGGFTLEDIESIMLNPTDRFGTNAVKIAEDLAQRKAALEAMFESMGIKGIRITENEGIKIGKETLEDFYKAGGKMHEGSMAKFPLPSKKATGSIAAAVLPSGPKKFKGVIDGEEILAAIMGEFDKTFPMFAGVRIPTVGKIDFPDGQMPADFFQYLKILEAKDGYKYADNIDAKQMWEYVNKKMQLRVYNQLLETNPDAIKGMSFEKYLDEMANKEIGTQGDALIAEMNKSGAGNLAKLANEAFVKSIMGIENPKDYLYQLYRNTRGTESGIENAASISGYHSLDKKMAHGFHAAETGDAFSNRGASITGQYELDDLYGQFGTGGRNNLIDEFPMLVGPQATQKAIDRGTMIVDGKKSMPPIPAWLNVSKLGNSGTGPFRNFGPVRRFNFNPVGALPASTWEELSSILGITADDLANMYKQLFPQNNMPKLNDGYSSTYLKKGLEKIVPLDEFGMPGKVGFDYTNMPPSVQDEVIRQLMALQKFLPEKLITDRFFPNKYAMGGLVSRAMPSPEPIPTQFAKGGMVYAARGGMLMNGKMYGGFSNGGMVPKYFADGGYSMGTDTVPAMLTPGEFVIKKSAVDRIGASTLAKINGYANGGLVGGASAALGDSVYNSNTYEINVNVSSNSNPDQIANAVMTKIRQIDNGRVRGLGR